ncbi:hypothetical protein LCGC14_0802220 [marine sediment metagenome]|uniref:Uncharacterized protein n=1 Tax=marine sediment metagenome TaxID=412755 RepID=A0A0F9SWH4_9ZZZZ
MKNNFLILLIFINLNHLKHTNLLGTFSRPKQLTEEDISISKERKICLVCKGNVGGFNAFFLYRMRCVILREMCSNFNR